MAVAASEKPPKGILLGSGGGGSVLYLEPPAAVPLNNELAAARGEAFAAEEAVLWRLTGLVVDVSEDMQRLLDTVGSLLTERKLLFAGICRAMQHHVSHTCT